MNLSHIWKDVLKLEAGIHATGSRLTRQNIKDKFNISERDARFIYDVLKNRMARSISSLFCYEER